MRSIRGSDASTATCRSSFANQPAGGAGARLIGLDRYEGNGRHGQGRAQVRHETLKRALAPGRGRCVSRRAVDVVPG